MRSGDGEGDSGGFVNDPPEPEVRSGGVGVGENVNKLAMGGRHGNRTAALAAFAHVTHV